MTDKYFYKEVENANKYFCEVYWQKAWDSEILLCECVNEEDAKIIINALNVAYPKGLNKN